MATGPRSDFPIMPISPVLASIISVNLSMREEVVGPAGPTTSSRMDKFTEMMLAKTGLIGMIGKSERGPVAIEAIRKHKAAYLMAVGGAAYLVAKAIKKSRVLAFGDLGICLLYTSPSPRDGLLSRM